MKFSLKFIFFFYALMFSAAFAQIVTIDQGTIKGYIEDGIYTYKGIPYATPPVGELRWQAPKPPIQLDDLIDATEYSKVCMQPVNARRNIQLEGMSEDCLTLNVWAPEVDAKKRPVMVYIHGGGFRTGSGRLADEAFAEMGAVVVSMNYRLGALGFFSHDALPGLAANPGLLDVIHSLKWVKSNIAAFGGDPENVTIFGISAGAMIVNLLNTNDSADGLFHRAIAQSGYAAWPLHRSNSAASPAPFNANLDQAVNAEQHAHSLIAKITDEPQTKQRLYSLEGNDIVNTVTGFHVPIVDGKSIVEEPAIRFIRGEQLDIAYMSGGNSFDGSSIGGVGEAGKIEFEASFGTTVNQARQLYASDEAGIWLTRMWGDNRYVLSARLLADHMKNKSSKAWLYYTDFVEEEDKQTLPGTRHGMDGAFLFGLTDESSGRVKALSMDMKRYWYNFASNGNPNSEGQPEWPSYNAQTDLWMNFGDQREVKAGIINEKLDFLEQKYLERVAPVLN